MKLLKDKVAIVTGGNRGIGKAIVDNFAKEDAIVISTYNSTKREDDNIQQEQLDVRNYNDVAIFAKKIIDKYGKIDILVNNAGIVTETPLIQHTEEKWDDILDTNLKSVFNLTKYVIPAMMKNGGSIINISSIVGVVGSPFLSSYSASKAGMIGLTKTISKEYGSKNIRCNAVAPGFIQTDMTKNLINKMGKNNIMNMIPLKRLGTTEDISNLVTFLASDLSSYITGQVIQIDGGMIL